MTRLSSVLIILAFALTTSCSPAPEQSAGAGGGEAAGAGGAGGTPGASPDGEGSASGGETFALEEPVQTTFYAGSPDGAWMRFAQPYLLEAEQRIDGLEYTIVQGGGVTNPVSIGTQAPAEAQIGMAYNHTLRSAVDGTEPYNENYPDGIPLVALGSWGAPIAFHFLVDAGLVPDGVTTLGEFLDTQPAITIATETPGSSHELMTRRLLNEYGYTVEDLEAWGGGIVYAESADNVTQLADGLVDAISGMRAVPEQPWIDLANSRDIAFLGLEPEVQQTMIDEWGYSSFEIPAGTYPGQDEPITSVQEVSVFAANPAISDELAYALTMVMLTVPVEELAQVDVIWEGFNPETADEGTGIPLHAGAERAYRELGYLSP